MVGASRDINVLSSQDVQRLSPFVRPSLVAMAHQTRRKIEHYGVILVPESCSWVDSRTCRSLSREDGFLEASIVRGPRETERSSIKVNLELSVLPKLCSCEISQALRAIQRQKLNRRCVRPAICRATNEHSGCGMPNQPIFVSAEAPYLTAIASLAALITCWVALDVTHRFQDGRMLY